MQYEDMDISKRIQTFIDLGKILASYPGEEDHGVPHPLEEAALKASEMNPWFTPYNIRYALNALGESMTREKFSRWLERYMPSLETSGRCKKTVGVVTAGNIPLAGFHDFLSVLISGHRFYGKLSGQDNILLPAIAGIMERIDPEWKRQITFTDSTFSDIEAIIATGSDNTFRYFEYYFSRFPRIIRKNRNGTAILSGHETSEELAGIASDVMLYFGLGCRSVSKIYIPEEYDLLQMLPFFKPWDELIRHNKYYNNYEYQKSIRIVNKQMFVDFGNILLSEDRKMASSVSVLNYERYTDKERLLEELSGLRDTIQCIVSASDTGHLFVIPGAAQKPELWDYADGTDTLRFLLEEI
ncbi:MAG: acyl-CoA reductase [Bacteroidetes bacterium]|nr:acyl-CoA reductase [Bacteroidota bacterium]